MSENLYNMADLLKLLDKEDRAHFIAEALTLETFGELESEKAKEFCKNAEEMLKKSKTN